MTAVLDDAQISFLEEWIQDYEQLYGVPTYASEETLNMDCSGELPRWLPRWLWGRLSRHLQG